MKNRLPELIDEREHKDFKDFVFIVTNRESRYLLRNDIQLTFREIARRKEMDDTAIRESSMARFLDRVHEMFIVEDSILILHRYDIAKYRFYRMSAGGEFVEEIDVGEYLKYKDIYVMGPREARMKPPLRIDFMPFHDYSPTMRDPRHIGAGIRYLNKHLSSSLFQNPERWGRKLFEFMQIHRINGQQLLVNGAIHTDLAKFRETLEEELRRLAEQPDDRPLAELRDGLKSRGFEEGWGRDAGRIRETMGLLRDLFNEPDPDNLERFVGRIPMISKIAIVSPHGWFGQENVLGKPDTGGQVIYILDQVRALEAYMAERFRLAGLDLAPRIIVLTRQIPDAEGTTCDRRIEKIFGTDNGYILRVPFKDRDQNVVRGWISRFHVWPYLDRFAYDSRRELVGEFQGKPDLIIGNYSDGNLVATLLSDQLDVIQCTIAHALEKTKYLFSDLYWKDMEPDYNFSLQFTADMIAMNKSDFVIASTYQEIAGTENSIGQYESHQFFTLPGLYRAVGGVNLFAPKFNIVPPGVDESHYFPYRETERRAAAKTEHWERRLFFDDSDDIFGHLEDPDKMPLFTMARFDKIKNITGLIEAFGRSERLRETCNLVFAAGTIDLDQSSDREEREQIQTAYRMIDEANLFGSVRWLPSINKLDTGEVYRIVADRRGAFIQPALFEAFGLTVLEAMLSGLPTLATQFGGPSEIIEDGKSGFLLNTSQPEVMAEDIVRFVKRCADREEAWEEVSENGIRRVREKFTWGRYSERLMHLTKLYGFWRYAVAEEGMVKMDRYCDVLYHLLLRDRAETLY